MRRTPMPGKCLEHPESPSRFRPPVKRLPIIQGVDALRDVPVAAGSKRIYIDTYGCQMNEHDSLRMFGIMAEEGFLRTDRADDADLIVLNSCSVREKAEQKLLSAAGEMKRIKRTKPNVITSDWLTPRTRT